MAREKRKQKNMKAFLLSALLLLGLILSVHCTWGELGGDCDVDTHCPTNALCKNAICVCSPGLNITNGDNTQCYIRANQTCTKSDICVDNAYCFDNICTCSSDYILDSSKPGFCKSNVKAMGERCELGVDKCPPKAICMTNGGKDYFCSCSADTVLAKDNSSCIVTCGGIDSLNASVCHGNGVCEGKDYCICK